MHIKENKDNVNDLPQDSSKYQFKGTGDSLADAISMLQINAPRRLFWGQCHVYIFGNSLAKSGIRKEIDYLLRHPGPRPTSFAFVSEAEALEMLILIPPLERYSGIALSKLTKAEPGMISTIKEVDKELMGDGESTSMPYIKVLDAKKSNKAKQPHQTIPVIAGTAIFKKDKMVGTLNSSESRGLLWLKDEVERSTVSIQPKNDEGNIILTPTLGSIKYKPIISKDQWIMTLNIVIEGDIVQNETKLNLMNEDILLEIKKEYEDVIKKRIVLTANKLQQDLKADVVNFGKKFHQQYPKEWNEVKDHWDEKFPQVEIKINVHAKVRRPGSIGPPAALPRDEVKE